MKIITLLLLVCVGLVNAETSTNATATVKTTATTATAEVKVIEEYPREINIPFGIMRGIVNVATCWLEYPRCLILKTNKNPFFGLVDGSLEGLFFTSCRACLSVPDIGLFGMTGPSAYNPQKFPNFVWNAKWNPYSAVEDEVLETPVIPTIKKDNYQFLIESEDLI